MTAYRLFTLTASGRETVHADSCDCKKSRYDDDGYVIKAPDLATLAKEMSLAPTALAAGRCLLNEPGAHLLSPTPSFLAERQIQFAEDVIQEYKPGTDVMPRAIAKALSFLSGPTATPPKVGDKVRLTITPKPQPRQAVSSAHANCSHPATKAARAKCRRANKSGA